MTDTQEYHQRFHDLLGHLTAIRSAASVLVEDHADQLPPDLTFMLTAMSDHSQQLATKLEELREKVYAELEMNKEL